MIRVSFNDGWNFKKNPSNKNLDNTGEYSFRPVTVPHDAMIGEKRDVRHPFGTEGGYYPGSNYTYTKEFYIPEEYRGKKVILEFEGVYQSCLVHVNDLFAGSNHYGYTCFTLDITPYLSYGAKNMVTVNVYNEPQPSGRWYSGGGVYRPVWMMVGDKVRVPAYGLKITTPDVSLEVSAVKICLEIEHDGDITRTIDVETEILDDTGVVVAREISRVTLLPYTADRLFQHIFVKEARLWFLDEPNLYTCKVTLKEGERIWDIVEDVFGIREIKVDPVHGLRLNGQRVLLRGECLHHDNGVLGAATFARAEERRVEISKEAGFNSIRISHNPASRAMLEACDRMGMLVMEESFDTWTMPKRQFDYARDFADNWERDVESIVNKDFNHPSVFMYSIGNEIREAGTPVGSVMNRKIADKFRKLDGSRFVTNAINVLAGFGGKMGKTLEDMGVLEKGTIGENEDINDIMTTMLDGMNRLSGHAVMQDRIRESADSLDVVGFNYARGCYEGNLRDYPNRLLYGSETFPPDIDLNWELVKKNPRILGDYTWTGWDYIGEAGIGIVKYNDRKGFNAPWPCFLAYCGDMNIIGDRRPMSYYREIVFGLRKEPYIAVQLPEHYADQKNMTPWATEECVGSWTWPGFEEKPCIVEVYSDAAEVELFLNGQSLGRKTTERFKVCYDIKYVPGELRALCYRDGTAAQEYTLRSAGSDLCLRAKTDRDTLRADGQDLAFVTISVEDGRGILNTSGAHRVDVSVEGPAVLQGLGSGDPFSTEDFTAWSHLTFEGRLLAVVRSTGKGEIMVRLQMEGQEILVSMKAE